MNTTEQIVEAKLSAYLDRRTPPRQILNNPAAQADEIDAILRTVLRYRPSGDLNAWWKRVEDGLSETCETYSWPLPRNFAKAAERASKVANQDGAPRAAWEPDPVKINAARMNNGDAVGEQWLYGAEAMALEALVPAETLAAYRSAAFFKRVHKRRDGTEDRSKAEAWEVEAKRAHHAAKATGAPSRLDTDVSSLVKRIGAGKETPSRNEQPRGLDPSEYMTPEEMGR